MPKIPQKIVIFGRNIAVKLVKTIQDDADCLGLYDASTGIIYIQRDLEGDLLQETFLHEVFHAIVERVGLRQALDMDAEEMLVEMLAKAINEAFLIMPRTK